jgi:hypothetical protein
MAIGHAIKQGIYVVGAKRTPFGAFGGSLKSHSPTDLQVFNLLSASVIWEKGCTLSKLVILGLKT